MSLLEIDRMTVDFGMRRGNFRAVEDVSLHLDPGEVLGVVGESGAGKSTLGNAVIGLLEPPGRMTAGQIRLRGERIDDLSATALRGVRGRRIGMIFQDPLTSLNPLRTIEFQLVETIQLHLKLDREAALDRALGLLTRVGIENAAMRIKEYPHQFSGGMRQRVVIALALCADPEVIIADEPTTALDVSIQAQILDLMRELCRERQVGMMIITHDMGVIADVTDRVAVMYRGRLVELGTTQKILGNPDHPYTKSLISAVPRPDVRVQRFPLVEYIESAGQPARELDLDNHWLTEDREVDPVGDVMVSVDDLRMRFLTRFAFLKRHRQYLNAVDGISFEIKTGEVFGLVGESGSGKSTVARMIAGLYRPSGGRIEFAGGELTAIQSETRDEPLPASDADDLPGPLQLTQSSDAGARHCRRADPLSRPGGQSSGDRGDRQRPAGTGRAGSGGRYQVPARVLRRAAPAHFDRPHPGDPAPFPDL